MASPSKKQKLNEIAACISSKLFLNHIDHQQFQEIHKAIDESLLIQLLNIPCNINKEIAEYATGHIKYCSNIPECKKQIFTLYQDIITYDSNHDNSDKVGFRYCYVSNKYYCNQCMQLTVIECDCECQQNGKLYFEPNSNKCAICEHIIGDCSCYWISDFESCAECKDKFCFKCSAHKYYEKLEECAECHDNFCSQCITVDIDNCDVGICEKCKNGRSIIHYLI